MKISHPGVILLLGMLFLVFSGCLNTAAMKAERPEPLVYSLYGENTGTMLKLLGNPTTMELTECIYELSLHDSRQLLTISMEIKDAPKTDFTEREITGLEYRFQGSPPALKKALSPGLWKFLKSSPPKSIDTYPAGKDLEFILRWKDLKIKHLPVPQITLQGFIPHAGALKKSTAAELMEIIGKQGLLEIYRENPQDGE